MSERLLLPCYVCGGVVIDLRCKSCGRKWKAAHLFYLAGYDYRMAEATVLAHGDAVNEVTHIFSVLELQQQAQRYIQCVQIPSEPITIQMTIDGQPREYASAEAMAEDIVNTFWR